MSVLTRGDDEGGRRGEERGSPGRVIAEGIGLTLAALVVSILGGVALIVPLFVIEFDIQSTAGFLALAVASQLGFLAVGYAYARYRDLRVPIDRPDRRDLVYGIGGAVLGLVVVTVLSIVVSVLDLVPGSVIDDAATADPNLLLGMAVLSVVLVAPVEEFLFRGVIQGRLRRGFGPVGAVAASSLLFGAMHLANYTGKVEAVIAGALLIAGTGSVLGAIYERTGNLVVPIVAHALYNVVLLLLAYAVS